MKWKIGLTAAAAAHKFDFPISKASIEVPLQYAVDVLIPDEIFERDRARINSKLPFESVKQSTVYSSPGKYSHT